MQLWVAQSAHTVRIHDVRKVAIWDLVNVCENDGLKRCERSILTAHSVLLATSEGAKDVAHIVSIEFTLVSKLIRSALHSPENVLEVASLHDVKSLRQPCQLLRVALLTSLAQVVLVVSHELFDLVPSVPSVLPIVLWAAASECDEGVDEHLAAIFSL